MLELKSSFNLALVFPNPAIRSSSASIGISISDLPPEVLDLILHHLYQDCHRSLDSIIPLSRTSRRFRSSSLPLLFESVSCVIRERVYDGCLTCFHRLAFQPHLLRHAKSLSVQKPLALPETFKELEQSRASDLAVLEQALKHMPQLQCIRYVQRSGLFPFWCWPSCSNHLLPDPTWHQTPDELHDSIIQTTNTPLLPDFAVLSTPLSTSSICFVTDPKL